MGICRLCNEEKRLIDAHLLPKCMYTFEKDMPLVLVNLSGNARPKRSPSGIYDSGILCADCDNFIGRWDKYACEKIHADRIKVSPARVADGLDIGGSGEISCFEVLDADPKTLSLFVLSVLWRYHHSTRLEAAVVELGPHESKIRSLLLSESSPNNHRYSVYLEYNPDFPVVVCKGRWKMEGGIVMNSFCAQGLTFNAKVDNRPYPESFSHLRLLEGRPVYALTIKVLTTPLGKTILRGIQKAWTSYGDPWSGLRKRVN